MLLQERDALVRLAESGRSVVIMCSDETYIDTVSHFNTIFSEVKSGLFKKSNNSTGSIQIITPSIIEKTEGEFEVFYHQMLLKNPSSFTTDQIEKIHSCNKAPLRSFLRFPLKP